ncbi:hypothetical protein BJQ94_02750 [Cryobacterium sp. SO2]|uniref:hypothetical protein n=1 Tax=Cryobacterium sp. SO2 TaxID=1897060 RepID=UPI00223CFAEA|nr:hypothetical protein [Cryobacterium sp. SO2]WEO77977.1 hypothetical protein BJQ94_02750 [Cryobacterium sp. SO2]
MWVYLGVLVFVLIDVLLISWALGSRTAGTPATTAGPIPTFTPETSQTPTPTAAAAAVAIPPTRLLSALDDTTAWRASTGECPTATATPELTTDAGETWQTTDATADVQVTAPLSLAVLSDTLVEMVGLAEADCAPQFVRSFVAGDEYANYPDLLADQWYVDPADRATVHTPAGEVAAPCDSVVSIAARSDDDSSAAIVCADTSVLSTTDSGATWSDPLKHLGIVSLADTDLGYVIATVGLPDCAGVQLTVLSGEPVDGSPSGCLLVNMPAEALQGNVAMSDGGGSLWIWAGDAVMRSTDQGTSWQ